MKSRAAAAGLSITIPQVGREVKSTHGSSSADTFDRPEHPQRRSRSDNDLVSARNVTVTQSPAEQLRRKHEAEAGRQNANGGSFQPRTPPTGPRNTYASLFRESHGKSSTRLLANSVSPTPGPASQPLRGFPNFSHTNASTRNMPLGSGRLQNTNKLGWSNHVLR